MMPCYVVVLGMFSKSGLVKSWRENVLQRERSISKARIYRKKLEGPGPDWVAADLFVPGHPDTDKVVQILRTRAGYFVDMFQRKSFSTFADDRSDLISKLVVHACSMANNPRYRNLSWNDFNRLLTTAYSSRMINYMQRSRVPPPLSSLSYNQKEEYTESLINKYIGKHRFTHSNLPIARPINLDIDLLKSVLAKFQEIFLPKLLSTLEASAPVNGAYQSMLAEVVSIFSSVAVGDDTVRFTALVRTLGYTSSQALHLRSKVNQALTAHRLDADEVLELCSLAIN